MATTTDPLNDTSERSKREVTESLTRFIWHPADSRLSIDVHPDVMDGIARDVLESLDGGPRGTEVGGLLLGSVDRTPDGAAVDRTTIRIERFHRISCGHTMGPEFILDQGDRAGLLKAASEILEASGADGSELSAAGIYRSHMRKGLQLENSDLELIDAYFHDTFDVLLLIKPQSGREVTGQFYVRGEGDECSGMQPVGTTFPYQVDQARTFSPPTLRSRRLIPDFVPEIVEPSHRAEAEPVKQDARIPDLPEAPVSEDRHESTRADWKKWWPLPASLLVAGAMLWMLLAPPGHREAPAPAPAASKTEQKTEPARPLGLYAATSGSSWRVSWNPNATALHDARSVQLFVREGDEQSRINLSPQDLASGTYNYKPSGNNVTFRLEVTESSGLISAESFHFVREVAPAPAVVPAPVAPKAVPAKQPAAKTNTTAPRATHKVPPVIPASIKPRIKGTIPIDVRVKIDARGRVISATLPEKHRAGLESYLAERAVEAAKQWKFEPAREDGKAVAGEQTLRFTFGK
jgi:hypothetical protein